MTPIKTVHRSSPERGDDTASWTGRSIADVFEAAAVRHAGRAAIEDEETRLTYAELSDRVDRIAATLAARLRSPHQHVALLVDPGADAVASILGTLKAGHVYVPLDPDDPSARLEFMLRDSRARTVLAGSAHVEAARRLGAGRCQVLPIDEAIRQPGSRFERGPIAADATAFVMYTSGSTGQPKGVLQTHRNLLHYVRRYTDFLQISPDDRLSMLYSLSFSASSMDVYGAVLSGATLCFLNVRRRGVARFASWVNDRRITVLHTVPTLFRHLLDHAEGQTGFPTVRAIDLGGEPVVVLDVEMCRTRFGPKCVLVNHLAATEISVIAQQVLEGVGSARGTMPVGPPAPGVIVRILKEDGSAAAAGEPGEIVIHSPFLSPGYWQQPALTAAAFGEDPERAGWRTYRSGDLGSMSKDGVLSALGRRDGVVKVRGHSVHLSEVEVALRRVPGVDEAAVVRAAEGDEAVRLSAWVVGRTLDAMTVRRALRDLLPSYACPSDVHLLDVLPRTPSGKIDRSALAMLKRPAAAPSLPSEPPQDSAEHDVAQLFARLLNVGTVGRHDDFFELGGDSLRFVELQTELERSVDRELPLPALLRAPTVAALAELLRHRPSAKESDGASSLLVPVRKGGSRVALFLVHGGAGTAGASPRLLEAVGNEQSVYAFRARGLDGRAAPHRQVSEIAAQYLTLMRQVQPEGPYHLGAVCAGALVAHEMACQLRDAGQLLAPLLFIDPPRPPHRQALWRRQAKLGTLWLARLMIRRPWTRSLLIRLGERRWMAALGRSGRVWSESQMRVWIWLRIAAFRHRLRVYEGPVQVIGSRERIGEFQPGGAWSAYLRGDVQTFEVAHVHQDVFNPMNADAAAQLRRCVELAQGWLARS